MPAPASDDPPPSESPTTEMPQQGSADENSAAAQPAPETGKRSAAESNSERTLGEFRMLRRLGAGGMAEVWLAEQSSLKRHVALKILKRELTDDETYVKRFESEAKAAAGLNHPNLVQVYTVGRHDGQHFIAQEYVQGQTLSDLLKRKGPLDATLALHIMRQTATALVAAAERNIVHRDIKPENIMLTRKGEVKVADFGLAQVNEGERLHLTQEGVTMGTPLYMSPEQVRGDPLDQRSDIYSFGVTCYHMLAGRPPFHGESAVSVAVQHLQDAPEPLGQIRRDLPRALCAMVETMMAKAPADRYQDARSVLADVRKLLKALKEDGAAADVALAELSSTTAAGGLQAPGAKKSLALRILLCVLVAAAGAGMGWLYRTPNLLEAAGDDPPSGVDKATSAQQQYLQALFSGGSEDAWLAVRNEWDDEMWSIRATEQLILYYLKQPERREDAQREIDTLSSYAGKDPRYGLEAKLAEAALAAYDGNLSKARTLLNQSRNGFENDLRGSWKDLYEELREQIDPPPSPPPGPPPPGEEPPEDN
ncbi:MAG: serine/threonine protein kinase [Planctomycetota bacterium]|nr:MAG: serine/threonine protein kinase [Planctomycetota bacterium]